MKKHSFIALLALAGAMGVLAEDIEIPSFKIRTPRTTGMGNAYISIAKGYETLWTNPASFNTDRSELTVLGLNASVLGKFSDLSDVSSSSLGGSTSEVLDTLEPVITGSGLGLDLGAGVSWVGKRIGLGLFGSVNAYMQGDPILSATGDIDETISLIGGYAHPFRITDDIVVSAGIALRPSMKYHIAVDEEFINEAMNDTDSNALVNKYLGKPMVGVPIDLGLRTAFPFGLSAAATIRDINARFKKDSGTSYVVPMSINVGGAWQPDMGGLKAVISPTVSVEVANVNKIMSDETGFFRQLRIGTELAFLDGLVTLWGGLDGGYPAFGTGLDLFFMDISVAYGTTEFGLYLGDKPVSNLTVEVSFKLD